MAEILGTTSRTPLVQAALADEARASIERVVVHLQADQGVDGEAFDLAQGSAGIAVVLATLARTLDRPEWLEPARRSWERSVGAIAARPTPPSLYNGFAGVAWATAHLRRQRALDLDPEFFAEVDTGLLDFVAAAAGVHSYDLVAGWVGFGVYALERAPDPIATRLLERIVARLDATAEDGSPGITWKTPPELLPWHQLDLAPAGYYNLGLAHGVPGVVAFLAHVDAIVGLDARGERLLAGAVEWMLAQRRAMPNGFQFPVWRTPDGAPVSSRLAWCYGDLGVAAALVLAGAGRGRGEWMRAGVEIARQAPAVEADTLGVRDHGICHGAAGVAHIFHRMALVSGDPSLHDAARTWIARTLAMRLPDTGIDGYATWIAPDARERPNEPAHWETNAGFLVGAGGVALVLAAAISNVEPEWDRSLLLSARTAANDQAEAP